MPKHLGSILAVLLTVFSALLLAACGGGGGSSSGGNGGGGTPAIAAITVSPSTGSLAVGATQQFTATAKDANGNTINGVTFTWASSNTGVATINGSGMATGVAAGSSNITASAGGITGPTIALTVTATTSAIASISISPSAPSIQELATQQFTATAKDASGNTINNVTFTWASSDTSVATIASSGLATGVTGGASDITASAQGITSSPVTLTVTAPTPVSDMAFYLAQNITDTLYANLPSQTQTFTYVPVFLFQNTSGGTLSITGGTVSGLSALQYGCNVTVSQQASYALTNTATCSLPNNGYYAVSGTLANTFASLPTSPTTISIAVNNGNAALATYDYSVNFVQYVPGHVAVRVVNAPSAGTVTVASAYGANMVNFAADGNNNEVGTLGSDASASDFQADQLPLSKTGGVIYMPYGSSGEIYLTRAAGGFNTTAVPSVTGAPQPPAFLQIELTYMQNIAGGACPAAGPTCESLTVDQTYVNFISMMGSFSAMGNTAPLALDTQAAEIHGVNSGYTQQQIFAGVSNTFNSLGVPWAYNKANGTANYIQEDSQGNITSIIAPVQNFGVAGFDPMASDPTYYSTYVSDLWTYLKTHPVYIDAQGTATQPATNSPFDNTDQCVLQGEVDTNPGDANYNELVFSVSSGNCPTEGYSVLPSMVGSACGVTNTQPAQPANLPCGDTIQDLVFDPFNACDFVLAAGNSGCHPVTDPTDPNAGAQAINADTFFMNRGLWGPNGTYRALIGRAIAGYQAAGLLPCSSAGAATSSPTQPMNAKNADALIAGETAFSNPGCLGTLPGPVYNVYTSALRPYVNVYSYSYGDFLGIDGTVTYSANALPSALYQNMPVAQPVTITLY